MNRWQDKERSFCNLLYVYHDDAWDASLLQIVLKILIWITSKHHISLLSVMINDETNTSNYRLSELFVKQQQISYVLIRLTIQLAALKSLWKFLLGLFHLYHLFSFYLFLRDNLDASVTMQENKHLVLIYGVLNQIFSFVFHWATIKMSIVISSRCLIYFMEISKGTIIALKIVWCVLKTFINGIHLLLRLPTKNLPCCKIVCNLQDHIYFYFSIQLQQWT